MAYAGNPTGLAQQAGASRPWKTALAAIAVLAIGLALVIAVMYIGSRAVAPATDRDTDVGAEPTATTSLRIHSAAALISSAIRLPQASGYRRETSKIATAVFLKKNGTRGIPKRVATTHRKKI